MRPACVAVDFDNTLGHFRNGYEGLFEVFTKRGISRGTIETIYDEVKNNGGFTLERLLRALELKASIRFETMPAAAIRKEFDGWLTNALIPYPESISTLEHISHSCPVVVVTFGETLFQRKKIASLRIPHNEILVTEDRNGKPALLEACLKKYGEPVVFVDDKASELDRVRDTFARERVMTIHLRRPNGKYRNEESRYQHYPISRLDELNFFLTFNLNRSQAL